MYYITYRNTTGEITRYGQVDSTDGLNAIIAATDSGFTTISTVAEYSDDDWYAPAGVVTARPTFPTTLSPLTIDSDGIDVATITSVPVNTFVRITSDSLNTGVLDIDALEVDDGTLEISSTEVGVFEVTFTNFPYKPYTAELEAV